MHLVLKTGDRQLHREIVPMFMSGLRPIRQLVTGIGPGEKIHEIMVSEDAGGAGARFKKEYSSADEVMTPAETASLLAARDLLLPDNDGLAALAGAVAGSGLGAPQELLR